MKNFVNILKHLMEMALKQTLPLFAYNIFKNYINVLTKKTNT